MALKLQIPKPRYVRICNRCGCVLKEPIVSGKSPCWCSIFLIPDYHLFDLFSEQKVPIYDEDNTCNKPPISVY